MLRKKETFLVNNSGNQCVLAARAIVSSIETLLGPNPSLKCYMFDDTTLITSSTCKVIEHLEIEHPVGFIINDVCQNFQKQFGCGCTTLICLIGYWAKHLQKLMDMGIPVAVISTIVDQSIQGFHDVFRRSLISIESCRESNFEKKTQCCETDITRSMLTNSEKQRNVDLEGETEKRGTTGWSESDDDDVTWFFDPLFENCDRTGNSNSNHQRSDSGENTKKKNFDQYLNSMKGQQSYRKNTPQRLAQKFPEFIDDNMDSGAGFWKDVKINDHLVKESTKSLSVNHPCKTKTSPSTTQTHLGPVNTSKPNIRILSRHFVDGEQKLPSTNHKSPCTIKHTQNRNNSQGVPCNTNTDVAGSLVTNWSKENPCTEHANPNFVSDFEQRHSDEALRSNKLASTDSNTNIVSSKNQFTTLNLKTSALDIFIANAEALAHGKENEMKFVVEIIKKQNRIFDNKVCLTSDYIDVQTIIGPHSRKSFAFDGVVLELSQENLSVLQSNGIPRRVMLINGDITFKYNHTGFKKPVEVTRILTKDTFKRALYMSERHQWITKIKSIVLEVDVGVVVSRGVVDKDLGNSLQSSNVVVIEGIRPKQLKMFSKMTNTSIITYPTDMEIRQLGDPVFVAPILSGLSLREHFDGNLKHGDQSKTFVQISPHHGGGRKATNSVVHTLVLCGHVPHVVLDSETKFWNCISRVHNALIDGQVLPGNGEIERRCIEYLENSKDSQDENDTTDKRYIFPWLVKDYAMFRPSVYDALIAGLKDFITQAQVPVDIMTPSDQYPTFDNYICKLEGWKRALRVVQILLSSEYQIITGIEKT